MRKPTKIRRRALRFVQDPAHPVFLFALTAEELTQIASVSRVGRGEGGELIGYQRPEVRKHVQDIQAYLDSAKRGPLFPNAVILALSPMATFRQVRGPKIDDLVEAGTLEIPLPREGQPKPAWIVDGQQRALALSRCKRRDMPVPISAFLADDVATQREQFLLVNSTKPLPRGLVSELLPEVDTVLPAMLAARKAPAALCDMLNRDPESPFHGLVHRASAKTRAKGEVVTDTALISLLQYSFMNPAGCLFSYRNLATGETDYEGVKAVLYTFWRAVKEVFPDAWGKPPTESRLMHSVGLRAMARVMDRVMATLDVGGRRAAGHVRKQLEAIQPVCAWTSGAWQELDGLKWNQLQSTPQHIRMLTNLLLRTHMVATRSAP